MWTEGDVYVGGGLGLGEWGRNVTKKISVYFRTGVGKFCFTRDSWLYIDFKTTDTLNWSVRKISNVADLWVREIRVAAQEFSCM